MKRKGGDVEMEKIRAIVDRQESRKETGMFLLFLGESLFVFSYFMKMSDFLFGMGLGMSMILNLLVVIFLSAKGERSKMMLLKAVASWNRKKSFEEYRRYLLRLFILYLSFI